MKIVELILDEDNEGVFAISLVDRPAIQENWIALSKNHKIEFKEVASKKNILVGAVLIPDMHIDRMGEDGEVFQVFFSGETITKTAHKFMKDGNQGNSTLQHKTKIEGVNVVETWLKEDMVNDKSVMYGFDYPLNTWLVSISVDNQEIRNKILKGEIKGFSIEGFFGEQVQMSEDQKLYNAIKVIQHFNTKLK
jgi:hypothetical protein